MSLVAGGPGPDRRAWCGGLIDPLDDLLDRFVPPPSGHRDWLTVDFPGLRPARPRPGRAA